MAPKKAKLSSIEASTSSSSKKFDAKIFSSFEASQRYTQVFSTKPYVRERGFENPMGSIHEEIEARGWKNLAKSPMNAILPIVREFFANVPDHINHEVFVRGKKVPFHAKAINALFDIEDEELPDGYMIMREEPNYDTIIDALTSGEGKWDKNTSNEVTKFFASMLTPTAKAWHQFISANFLPSNNISEVTKERAILNFAILDEDTINVGHLIHNSILAITSARPHNAIGHISIITQLCLKAGVRVSPNEQTVPPLSDIVIDKIINSRSRRVPKSLPLAPHAQEPSLTTMSIGTFGETLEEIRKQLKAQLEWQQKADQRYQDHRAWEVQQFMDLRARQDLLGQRQDAQLQYFSQLTSAIGAMPMTTSTSIVTLPQPPHMPSWDPMYPSTSTFANPTQDHARDHP